MNERIKLLAEKCWSHRVDGALVDGQLHFDQQKFAELLVEECNQYALRNWEHGHLLGQDLKIYFGFGVNE